MDRTVPSSANEDITLYLRTYYSLLRSSSKVQIKTVIEAHKRIHSALHVKADEPEPDFSALTYSILRMPACLPDLSLILMGQSEFVFSQNGYPDVETWQPVIAVGRRRRSFYDGQKTLGVYIASRSDIDDLIPILTAYQIEQNKLHRLFRQPAIKEWLDNKPDGPFSLDDWQALSDMTGVEAKELARLALLWPTNLLKRIRQIAYKKQELSVQMLAGSLADYKRATRRWWINVERKTPGISFQSRPVYFISSNTHSLTNLLSGFALMREEQVHQFLHKSQSEALQKEYHDILEQVVPSNHENFLYYALKKLEAEQPEVETARLAHEKALGIVRVPSNHAFDIEVQVIPLEALQTDCLDPRLRLPGIESLEQSDALIINIDYPLGMAAYQILTEVARNIAEVRGIYIMGKAATLNGRIGDVMIPNVVHDEHTLNTYIFTNCFSAQDVAPYLVYGTVLDNQKAITVPGTFLQNERYMSVFYKEGYTDMEMEAGPYLSGIYEMVRPKRHPYNEIVNLTTASFPIGMLHYASDTPFSKGTNLGSQNLSYFGMDPTYATMVAITRAIFQTELDRLSRS